MSKYKIGVFINSRANHTSTTAEVIDLIEDYGYTEEEAEKIIKDDKKIKKIFEEWLWDTVETGYEYLETEEDVKEWERMDD
jgi:hypothetical protein F3_00907